MNTHTHVIACGRWGGRGRRQRGGEEKSYKTGRILPNHGVRSYHVPKSPYFHYEFSLKDNHSFESLHPGGCVLFLIIRMSFTISSAKESRGAAQSFQHHLPGLYNVLTITFIWDYESE